MKVSLGAFIMAYVKHLVFFIFLIKRMLKKEG